MVNSGGPGAPMLFVFVFVFAIGAAACSGAGGDSVDARADVDAHVASQMAITCDRESTKSQVRQDGTRIDVVTRFALIDLDVASAFRLEQCGQYTTTDGTSSTVCPQGSDCTTSGDPLPFPADTCYSARGGNFVDGRLYVVCETQTTTTSDSATTVFRQGYTSTNVYR